MPGLAFNPVEIASPPGRRYGYGEARDVWLGSTRQDHRICTVCRQEQPLESFHRIRRDRRTTVCRSCRLTKQKEYRAARPAERATRDRLAMVGWRFGLTPESVAEILIRQGNCCAICGKAMTRGRGVDAANLDHKRGTRQPRGFLCKGCNIKVGHYEHVQRFSAEFIAKMTAYLRIYESDSVEVLQTPEVSRQKGLSAPDGRACLVTSIRHESLTS
jgi:Recombination endonuclease VII